MREIFNHRRMIQYSVTGRISQSNSACGYIVPPIWLSTYKASNITATKPLAMPIEIRYGKSVER